MASDVGAPAAPATSGLFDDIPMSRSAPQGGAPVPARQYGRGALPKAGNSGGMSLTDRLADAGRSVASGLDKGVAEVAALPVTALSLLKMGSDYSTSVGSGRPFADVAAETEAAEPSWLRTLKHDWSGEELHRNAKLPGTEVNLAYKPKTTAGEFIHTAAEFLPGAVLAPGSVLGNALKFGVAPGVAAEAAGQINEGTPLEPYARAIGALGAGGIAAASSRPSTAGGLVREAASGMTPAQLDAMEALIQDAGRQGVALTRPEAAQFVTNGATKLADLQRIVEGQGGLKGFMAERGGQIDTAARKQFDAVGPAVTDLEGLGRDVQGAAGRAMAIEPEALAFDRAVKTAPAPITPEKAGNVIQPELRKVYDKRETARATQAESDYGAARRSDSWVPVEERPVEVTRQGERPMTAQEMAAERAGALRPRLTEADGPAPVSLSEFIARNGGLSLDGGEAAAMGFDKWNVPFGGRVARQGGKSIDGHWRDRLAEEGYIPFDQDGLIAPGHPRRALRRAPAGEERPEGLFAVRRGPARGSRGARDRPGQPEALRRGEVDHRSRLRAVGRRPQGHRSEHPRSGRPHDGGGRGLRRHDGLPARLDRASDRADGDQGDDPADDLRPGEPGLRHQGDRRGLGPREGGHARRPEGCAPHALQAERRDRRLRRGPAERPRRDRQADQRRQEVRGRQHRPGAPRGPEQAGRGPGAGPGARGRQCAVQGQFLAPGAVRAGPRTGQDRRQGRVRGSVHDPGRACAERHRRRPVRGARLQVGRAPAGRRGL